MNIAFALEYSLGHTTHAQNLKRVLEKDSSVTPTFIDLPYHDTPGWWSRLPGIRSNWSARASLGAYLGLRSRTGAMDAALFHTQVTSLFSTGLMSRVPSVVSLDATPIQYDALGEFYGHASGGNARIENLKKTLNERAFAAAKHLVTWSQWAKDSLTADYGVPPDKITVIPPGIDTELWTFDRDRIQPSSTVNVLFVGGDFIRKGGDTLLESFRALPGDLDVHLDIVSKADGLDSTPAHVTVHRDITPNSPKLRQLFASADIFAFPTRADCLPLAVMEALASSLPVITTQVGALPEAVVEGKTGLIVPPGDSRALSTALTELARNPERRSELGFNARREALARFDASKNYTKLIDVVKSVAAKK